MTRSIRLAPLRQGDRAVDQSLRFGRELLQILKVERGEEAPFFFHPGVHVERERVAHRHRLRRLPEVIRPDQRLDGRMQLALPEVGTKPVLVLHVVQQLRDERADLDGDAIRRAFLEARTAMTGCPFSGAGGGLLGMGLRDYAARGYLAIIEHGSARRGATVRCCVWPRNYLR